MSKHQRVRIQPASESERPHGFQPPTKQDSAPIRCQLWDGDRLIGVVPVTLDDQGHASDVVYTPGELERIDRLAFVYGGRVFVYPTGAIWFSPAEPLHLALAHLKLIDKFGLNALKAGR